jgi:uncharacterized protein (DUF1697 family)
VANYVALLRGINVGGKNLVAMPALRACFEEEGFESVSTYIQSGNVLFEAPGGRTTDLAATIEAMLARRFDYEPTVVVRNLAQMRASVAGAPAGFGSEPNAYRYDVIFLKEPLTAAKAMKHVATNPAVDRAEVGRGVLYFSRLTARATASRMSQIVSSPIYRSLTIRNWATTTRLLSLMDPERPPDG